VEGLRGLDEMVIKERIDVVSVERAERSNSFCNIIMGISLYQKNCIETKRPSW
jgi:hypothetical protein